MGPIDSIERHFRRYRTNGSPRELASALRELSPHLMATARRSGLDESGAEDVVQETFLACIAAEERFDDERLFVPWARGILQRQIKAERRREARRKALLVIGSGGLEDSATQTLEAPDAGPMVRAELRAKLQGAIAALGDRNGAVVEAALLRRETMGEIAQRLEISKSAVAVRLHRGLRQVRERLGERSSLALLAWTLPRHKEVLPGVIAGGLPLGISGMAFAMAAACLGLLGLGTYALLTSARGNSSGDLAIDSLGAAPGSLVQAAELEEVAPPSRQERSASAPTPLGASADEPIAAARVILRGDVSIEDGTPVPAGAEVFAIATDPALVLPTAPLQPVATANAEGRYEILDGTLGEDSTPVVMVRAGGFVGYADLTADHLREGVMPTIKLVPEVRILLTVTDEDGEPIEGVELSGMTDSTRFQAPVGPIAETFGYIALDPYHHLFGGSTGADGRGAIRGLFGHGGQGLFLVFSARKEGYARCTEAYIQDDGHDLEVSVTMYRTADLSLGGVVFDEQSQPLEGAEVRFSARGEAPLSDAVVTRSDRAGRWSLPTELLDEYPIFLSIGAPGYSPRETIFEGPEALDGVPLETRLQPSAPLTGSVVDEYGMPVVGAQVAVTTQFASLELVSDERGEFRAEGLTVGSKNVFVVGSATSQASEEEASVRERSVRVPVDRGVGSVTVTMPQGDSVPFLVVRQAEGLDWKRVELIPVDVEAAVESCAATGLRGDTAEFHSVFVGRWIVAALTEEDQTCLRMITVEKGGEVEFDVLTDRLCDLNALGDAAGAGADAQGEHGLFLARRRGFPGLPPWLDHARIVPLSTFYSQMTPGKPLELGRLVPGTWDVFAAGPGWAAEPQQIELSAGEALSLNLKARKALPLHVSMGAIHRSSHLVLECRRSESDPWTLVALWSVVTGQGQEEDAWLLPGDWSWRATLEATNEVGDWFELVPPLEGRVSIEGEEGVQLDLWL